MLQPRSIHSGHTFRDKLLSKEIKEEIDKYINYLMV